MFVQEICQQKRFLPQITCQFFTKKGDLEATPEKTMTKKSWIFSFFPCYSDSKMDHRINAFYAKLSFVA